MTRSLKSWACALTLVWLATKSADAEIIYGLTTDNHIVTFSSTATGTLNSDVAISNLQPGEQLVGIDFRPANSALYAVGSTSRLYTVNTITGAATQVGGLFNVPLSGSFFGVDFNPAADLLRVVSNTGQNLRIGPTDGIVRTNVGPGGDGTLQYNPSTPDRNAGVAPRVVAAAYTNNVPGASATTLFVLDAALDVLATQAPPNDGVLNTIANLSINLPDLSGFDISGATGLAYVAAGNSLWTLNTTTGQATFAGSIGTGSTLSIVDITAAPVPEPATIILTGLALIGLGLAWRRRISI